MSMEPKIRISVVKSVSFNKPKLLADNFKSSNNTGTTQGNPRIAVNMWLLPVLAPMADMNENMEAKPIPANKIVNRNNG